MALVHDDHKPTPDTEPDSLFNHFDEAPHNRNGHTGDDPRFLPDMIAYTDQLIGRVVAKLDEHGLRERTLVVVMGDNGTKEIFTHVYPDGARYPGRKGGTADNGTHVPLIFNLPGTIVPTDDRPYTEYTGIVDVTDIFPTLAEATGVAIPRREELDGASFWSQVRGLGRTPHREHVYAWWNGNFTPAEDTSQLLRYAFTKDFKYYAPTTEFPRGRFFDLRLDSLEEAGNPYRERRWGVRLYPGLDQRTLTAEQRAARDSLRAVTARHRHRPVSALQIIVPDATPVVGQPFPLSHRITPAAATRNNVIWESNRPEVATVDKFGTLHPHSPGEVTVSLYSWEDAVPRAAGPATPAYRRDGIRDRVTLRVRD